MPVYAIAGAAPATDDDVWMAPSADVIGDARLGSVAGALVTEGRSFPPGSLTVGSPARAIRSLPPEATARLGASAEHYRRRAKRYAGGVFRLD